MKNYPKISIVTPVFNSSKFLKYTIESIVGQGYPNLEYIIIDGNSSDNSLEIIKKYSEKISYWISEPDKGIYDAVQKGFQKSTGDIMGWINADDLHHGKSLFILAEIFNEFKEIKWLTGLNTIVNENGSIVRAKPLKKWSKYQYYRKKYFTIQQESTFWKRELWDKSGSSLNINLKLAGDLDLWMRFFQYEKLYSTSSVFAGFRVRKGQKGEDSNSYEKEVRAIYKSFEIDKHDLKKIKMINFFEKSILRVPLVNQLKRVEFLHNKLFEYPPSVDYHPKKGFYLR